VARPLPAVAPRPDAATGRYAAGVVNHGTYDDLEACLASLRRQERPPAAVYVVDTGVDPARLDALVPAWPDVHFERRPNLGWGAGVNRIFEQVAKEHDGLAHVLILNPDVDLDADFARVLLDGLAADDRIAIAGGLLLRPGRDRIDSAGILLPRHRRPRDRGSNEPERGQYDQAEFVFGVSGAAMLVRRAALDDLAVLGEIVDEDFFAYHDDTDLCWRANRLGWRVLYEPHARAVHGRRWQRELRMQIEPFVRRHSFKNHYLQIIKNERFGDLVVNLPWLLVWEMLRLGFALVRDPAVLPAYGEAWRSAGRAFAKRRAIQARLRTDASLRAPAAPLP
jgi:GT2 family glycosyltransferase